MKAPEASVVVLAYGAEEHLSECVAAVLSQTDVDLELLLVDNGAAPGRVDELPADPRIRIISPGRNLGFAGGCNEAAKHAAGSVLVLVNSDAIVAPGAVRALIQSVADPSVGLASGGVRLAGTPETMNSIGNPVQYLGLVWAGGFGEPASLHPNPTDVASASGAFLAITVSRWRALGGFPEEFFAYHEDAELSLRAWQRGWRVRFIPDAVAFHHYEFSRNPAKQYLLERNRWLTVLTVYPTRLLRLVLPAMLAFEVPLCAIALIQGWLPQKLRSWWWLFRHRRDVARRRRDVQAASVLSTADFARLLSARIEPAMVERPPGIDVLNAGLAWYWRLVCRALAVSGGP